MTRGWNAFAGLAAAALLTAGGCARSAAETHATPPAVMAETFKECRWERVRGRELSVWSYACGPEQGNVRLRAADEVGGFALVSSKAGAAEPGAVVIRTFRKAPEAPVAAILPAVLRATGDHMASCRLVAHPSHGDWGAVWLLEPTGAEKAAWEAANAVEPQENPCGRLGVGPVGDRFFRPLAGDPARVIHADMGSEIQVFDLASLRPASPR